MNGLGLLVGHLIGDFIFQNDWLARNKKTNSWICAIHCVVYALGVWSCSFHWFPLWAVVLTGVIHFPIDRWGLARKLMAWNNQEEFATGPLSPWSIVSVDQTLHLLTLYLLGIAVEGVAQEAIAWNISLSVLSLLILGAGGYWLWRRKQLPAPVEPPAPPA